MSINAILLPAVVLILWTLVMLGWTAASRFPAMAKSGMDLTKAKPGGRGQDLDAILPPQVVWKSHNHTHLHEQPTLFYAVVAIIAIAQLVTPVMVALAWAYVVLRIIHSVYQATVNVVRVRFMLFLMSTTCLIALALMTAIKMV